jgi:predicted aspartyl protease
VILKARVNGGPPLRLLVDSGSEYVVLTRSAAARSGCVRGAGIDLIGAGATSAAAAAQSKAGTFETGDLTLHDIPLVVTDRGLGEGLHGVVPLSIFANFSIRVDFRSRELTLSPLPNAAVAASPALRAVIRDQLLFLPGIVNERQKGLFLLDTGSAYSALAAPLAHQLQVSELMSAHLPLQGGTADVDGAIINGAVNLRLGAHQVSGRMVAVDLSLASRYHRMEIAGLVGYQALCDSILTVNYRDHLIRIDSK